MDQPVHAIGTRIELRQTFNNVAQQYDEMRPSYPQAVFADVLGISGVDASSHLLEIGCGTGHATEVFAARGLRIHCVELGENMAAIAGQRLAAWRRVSIEIADFDHWTTTDRYDLAFSATAYHWLNPATREQHIASILKPSGWLAIWRNRHIRNGSCDDFLDEAREIYAREAPLLIRKRALLPGPDEVLATEAEKFDPRLFAEPETRLYFWSVPYTAATYVQMMATHSDHQLLPRDARERLLDGLASLIDTRYGGSVVKDYATVLQMARKRT